MSGMRSTARRVYTYEEKSNRLTNNNKAIKRHHCDFTLLSSIILLNFIGIVMITSSSFYYAYNKFGDSYVFFKKQFMWLGISCLVMVFFMNLNYRILKKSAVFLYLISNVLLIVVLIAGEKINGAKRWLGVGPIGFQPSEFAKVTVIIFISYYISKNYKKIRTPKLYIKTLILILIPVTFIAIENFSTAIVIIAIGVALLFIGGIKIKHMLITAFPIVGLGGIFVALPLLNIKALSKISDKFSYRLDRIRIWLDPWADPTNLGFQTIQSLYAVGSGGLFGVGLGQSIQKRGFIPEAHNDIIFSVICEELGLFGASIVLLLFVVLIWRGIKIAMNAPDLFGSLVVAGAITQVAVQVIINVAVNTNTIPVTGMPLPFISYGGSSLMFLMMSMGIVLNISRFCKISD